MTILRKFDKKNFRLKKKKKKKMNNDDKYCFFNGDEKEVVKILQQLPQFILESESSSYPKACFLLITWGVKKRRSLTNISYSPLPCNNSVTTTTMISSGKSSFIPSNPLSFSSSKHPTCTNKAKKMKDTLTSSSRKQENQRKTFVKLMMGDCKDQKLELKSSPSFPDQQRDKLLHSNSSRRSFDLSSAAAAAGGGGPTVLFSPAPEEEEEESLTKVADESRFGSEMNEKKKKSEYPYSQSLSGEVGHLVMAKHLSIPDLNLGPDENLFKSFDMNKQPTLQMYL